MGLLSDPFKMNMVLNGLGLLGSKWEPQSERYKQNISQGLLQQAQFNQGAPDRDLKKRLTEAEIGKLGAEASALGPPTQGERKTIKGIDNRQYWKDTLDPVFPGLEKPGVPEQAKDVFDQETKLRKEYDTNSKEYIKQTQAYKRVVASAKDPSAAGDLALIFNYMKVLDPGSTVREGEFATAQNSGGVGSRVIALYNNLRKGERLSHTQRSDFTDRAGRLYTAAKELQSGLDERYVGLAERNNLSSDNILYKPVVDVFQYPQELLDNVENEVMPETRVINGRTYTKIDGKWYD